MNSSEGQSIFIVVQRFPHVEMLCMAGTKLAIIIGHQPMAGKAMLADAP